MSSHLNKYWLLIIALLLVSLISGIALAVKQSRHLSRCQQQIWPPE
jgi:hypothetical protein